MNSIENNKAEKKERKREQWHPQTVDNDQYTNGDYRLAFLDFK